MTGQSQTTWRRMALLAVLAAVVVAQDTPAPQPEATQTPAAPASSAPPISGLASGANVAIIRIEGDIYGFTSESLQRRLDRAMLANASLIVIEVDTFGGELRAALEISKMIKRLNVPTVAWINSKAYSAGILIASSCDQIVMAPGATAGDCAPIVPGMDLSPTERAKVLSPLLAEFRANSTENNLSYALLHAMCEWDVKVYELEHIETAEHKYVNEIDRRVMVEGKDLLSADEPGFLAGMFGRTTPVGLGVYEAADEDRGMWKDVRPVHNGKTLLTVSHSEAKAYGLAMADDIATETQLQQYLAAASMTRIYQSWSEVIAGFLTRPMVRIVLVIALMLGGYLEFQSPGLSAPGAVAFIALLGLVCPPFIIGLAEIWHVIAMLIGFVLIILEIFVAPGFGVLGISGIVLLFMGLVLMVVPTTGQGPLPLPLPQALDALRTSLLSMFIGVIASAIGFVVLAKYFGSIPLLSRLILESPVVPPQGVQTTIAGDEVIGQGRISVGDRGRVVAELRPSGRAMFAQDVVDVVSAGEWVGPGRSVQVVEIHGNRIVVEADNS